MHLWAALVAAPVGSGSGALLAIPAARAAADRRAAGRVAADGRRDDTRDGTRQDGLPRPRPWRLGAVTGLYCGALAARLGLGWALLPCLPLGLLGPALGAIDRAVHALPDRWVALLALGTALGMAATLLATRPGGAATAVLAVLGGAALSGGAYLALALARPGSLGLGDVKLAVVLGGCLTWFGPARLVDGTAAGLALAAAGGARVLVRGGRRDARFALGPHLLAGTLLALAMPSSAHGG